MDARTAGDRGAGPGAGGGDAAVPARADPAAHFHLEVAAGAFDALMLPVEQEVGEGRLVHERGLLPVGGCMAALAVGRPAGGRELPGVGIGMAGTAVALQRLVANRAGEVDDVAPRALCLLVRAGQGVRRFALVIEAHLREGGDLMTVGAARLLDAHAELTAVLVGVAGVAPARVAPKDVARLDHLILPPAPFQEGADGRYLRSQRRIGLVTSGAGCSEVPALERVLLVHRGVVDRRLERAEAVARIARARR